MSERRWFCLSGNSIICQVFISENFISLLFSLKSAEGDEQMGWWWGGGVIMVEDEEVIEWKRVARRVVIVKQKWRRSRGGEEKDEPFGTYGKILNKWWLWRRRGCLRRWCWWWKEKEEEDRGVDRDTRNLSSSKIWDFVSGSSSELSSLLFPSSSLRYQPDCCATCLTVSVCWCVCPCLSSFEPRHYFLPTVSDTTLIVLSLCNDCHSVGIGLRFAWYWSSLPAKSLFLANRDQSCLSFFNQPVFSSTFCMATC